MAVEAEQTAAEILRIDTERLRGESAMAQKISRIFFWLRESLRSTAAAHILCPRELKVRTVVADRMRFSASVAMALLKHMRR